LRGRLRKDGRAEGGDADENGYEFHMSRAGKQVGYHLS
jgi:hypothetical protein